MPIQKEILTHFLLCCIEISGNLIHPSEFHPNKAPYFQYVFAPRCFKKVPCHSGGRAAFAEKEILQH